MKSKILFIHGWATDSWVWEGCSKAIAGESPILSVSLPGHGGRFKWNEPTLMPGVREVLEKISPAGEREIIGVGWSFGGEVLIASVSMHPERFRGLVLVGTTPCFVAREGFPFGQSSALVKRMIMDMKKDPGETVKRFYELNFTPEELRTEEARLFIEHYKFPGPVTCVTEEGAPPGCYPAFRYSEITTSLEALYNMDLRERLGRIDVPTLIIHGQQDSICPVEAGKFLSENINGSALKIFEKTGHAPFVARKEEFSRVVREFVKGL